jgi:hypothetical protein
MLAALALLVVPLIRELPPSRGIPTGLFAWLLVALALYWLYAGMGYRPLLLLQLLLFSGAATLLTARLVLGVIAEGKLGLFRAAARGMIMVGAGLAGTNLVAMLLLLWRRSRGDHPFSNTRA